MSVNTQKYKYKNREEQARLEVGNTEISPKLSKLVIVFFIAVIIFVPVFQFVYELKRGQDLQEFDIIKSVVHIFRAKPDSTKNIFQKIANKNELLLNNIKDYEANMEDNSLLQKTLLAPIQSIFTRTLHVGNEKVYVGKDNWLFYRNDVDYLTSKGFLEPEILKERVQIAAIQPDPIPAILNFKKQLEKLDIELIIMPIPNKAMLLPEKLTSFLINDKEVLQNASYAQFINTLTFNNVNVFDVSELFLANKQAGNDVFLKTDTHWTPEMMQITATFLANKINNTINQPSDISKYIRKPTKITSQGDIANMLKLDNIDTHFSPQTITIQQVLQNNKHWQADENAEILLLGDSYTNIFSDRGLGWGESSGFAEQLSYELKTGIDRISQNAGGAYSTRETLANELMRGNNRLRNKKVLIWQFAVRELLEGDWKVIPMNLQHKKESEFLQLQSGDSVFVSGEIISISKVPKPGTVPYKDHVVSVVLSDLEGGVNASKALVYMLSMNDNKWTAAANLKVGNQIKIRLTSWDDAKQKYENMNRSEPENDAYAFEQPCWGKLIDKEHKVQDKEIQKDILIIEKQIQKNNINTPGDISNLEAKTLHDVCTSLLSKTEALTIKGTNGWLFHRDDLIQITSNQFWGDSTLSVNPDRKLNYADPLEALKAYNEECKKIGIKLLVVPIPLKASIYPDFLSDESADISPIKELTPYSNQFYAALKTSGVALLDLRKAFFEARKSGVQVYCKHDSHFSGDGAAIVASEVAKQIKNNTWYNDVPNYNYKRQINEITIKGDLNSTLSVNSNLTEKISLQTIKELEGDFIQKSAESPVYLLTDSHGLVFHEGGDMFAVGAGLFDLLSAELEFPINMTAIKGSAGRTARITLYRELQKEPELKNKIKVIVYCFTAREFTSGAWGIVPLQKSE